MHQLLRTALAPAPEGKAITTVGGQPDIYGIEGRPGRRLSNRAAARHSQAYGGTDAIDWVMDCVDLYAQTTSNATFHFERDGKELLAHKTPADPDASVEAPQDLVNLFERPNEQQDYTELIELAVIDLLLAGEFIWYKFESNAFGKPQQIFRLSPAAVQVVPGATTPEAYIYTAPGGGRPQEIDPADIVHVKRPNPHDPWRGLGVIAGGPRAYDLELALTEQMANYYEQGTKLSGVLESERSIPPTVFDKIKKQFSNLYSGARNAYKVAMLERGLRFRSISATAQEAQFVEVSKWSRDRISTAFRVPGPLLGDMAGADRQAVREAQRIFDNKTMRPFLNRMQSMISKGLTQAWGVDFVIDYEYIMPIEDRFDLADRLATLPGVRVREVRAQVELEPLGDERDDIVLNLPGLDRAAGGHPDQPIGTEPGRTANPANTVPFPAPGQPLPASADASKAIRDIRGKMRELRSTLAEIQNG